MNGVPEKPRVSHFAAVDGLRGLACLAVVAHHCYVHCGRYAFLTFAIGGHEVTASRLLYFGNGGVDMFFVLSGFCLAYPYFKAEKPEPWGRYFAKRAARILPPYYAAVALFWLLLLVERAHPLAVFGSTPPVPDLPTFRQVFVALTMLGVYFNPSFWTMAIEARWYFVLPILLILWRRTSSTVVLGLSVLVGGASLLLSERSAQFYWLIGHMLAYLPTFALGILAAHLTVKDRVPVGLRSSLRWVLLASLVILALLVPNEGVEALGHHVVAWAQFSFVLLMAALHDPLITRYARSPALVTVGAFSYSLYVVHEPVVHFVYERIGHLLQGGAAQFVAYELVLAPICVALGYLFYRIVEAPSQNLAKAWFARGRNPRVVPAAAGIDS